MSRLESENENDGEMLKDCGKDFVDRLKNCKGKFERGMMESVGGLAEHFAGLLGKNLRVQGKGFGEILRISGNIEE